MFILEGVSEVKHAEIYQTFKALENEGFPQIAYR